MAQEFVVKSAAIEDKINQLLPSQGGFQAGVDFSASTMVVPIVDLTETAEGSPLRQDLQTALSLTTTTDFNVQNASLDLINTTGFYRIFGAVSLTGSATGRLVITDGATSKDLIKYKGSSSLIQILQFDFTVELAAGDTFQVISNNANCEFDGCSRQVADISGNLT